MLPAMLHVSKYKWPMFYFLNCILFYISILYYGSVPVNSGWRTSSSMPTTVRETMN